MADAEGPGSAGSGGQFGFDDDGQAGGYQENYDLGEGGGEGAASYGESDGSRGGRAGVTAAEMLAYGDVAEEEDITTSIPAFANAENRALHQKLLEVQRKLANAAAETLEHQERVGVMQEHLKNIQLELVAQQKVLESKNKEMETEDHLKQLADRAVGRMRQDMSALEGTAEAVQVQLSSVQASVYKGTEKLEAFREAMNWKQDELDKWAAAARQKEEDNLALDKYTRADEAKIKDLTRELERLAAHLVAKKRELEAEHTETTSKQVELDKCAEDFRALHAQRQDLIRQWQESLDAIRQRDDDIAKAGEKYVSMRTLMNERRDFIKAQEAELASMVEQNNALEHRIEGLHRAVGNNRDAVITWTERVNRIREQVDNLKSEVSAAASELARRRAENENYIKQMEEKKAAVDAARQSVSDTKKQLEDSKNAAASVEEQLAKKEEFLRKEAVRVEKAEKALAQLKEAEFRAKDTLQKLKGEEEAVEGEMAGVKRAVRNMSDRIAVLDAQAMKQHEHVYAADFQIQQMERKVRDKLLAARLPLSAPVACTHANNHTLPCHAVTCRSAALRVRSPARRRCGWRARSRSCGPSRRRR